MQIYEFYATGKVQLLLFLDVVVRGRQRGMVAVCKRGAVRWSGCCAVGWTMQYGTGNKVVR